MPVGADHCRSLPSIDQLREYLVVGDIAVLDSAIVGGGLVRRHREQAGAAGQRHALCIASRRHDADGW